ncbi:GNAT family N-acetyltransferase [Pleionea litopenaei]|uniref:GNAT family N-acetyltransferase n=1 Tax=Pleionea litopenaei TaxID=3070815 RepID=A0AA51RQF2_9GAMM|nr:GNAT family N-acetyltransferase [Pleionea sp. HL-JVS1]WMS85634.1 GNAT family N-acetyltransferase [Pleionea sp. HL-JVS1]
MRIDDSFRGQGIGEKMFLHAFEMAKEKGCKIVQLTSDKLRPDAIRFYEKLGFKATHEGFKLAL